MRKRQKKAESSAARSDRANRSNRLAMYDLGPQDQTRRLGNISLIRRVRQVFRRQDTQSAGGDAYIRARLHQHLE